MNARCLITSMPKIESMMDVYKICESIPDSIPETFRSIDEAKEVLRKYASCAEALLSKYPHFNLGLTEDRKRYVLIDDKRVGYPCSTLVELNYMADFLSYFYFSDSKVLH